jgi:hypothetical protein
VENKFHKHGKVTLFTKMLTTCIIVSVILTAQACKREKHNFRVEFKLSEESRKRFERIEQKNLEANGLSNYTPDSSKNTPGFLNMALEFEEVESIERFQLEYLLWLKEKKIQAQREELKMRLSNLSERGIVHGQRYAANDYISRFSYMLDIISLLGELGEFEKAKELADFIWPSAYEGDSRSGDPPMVALQMYLRSEALWTMADVFAIDTLFQQSIVISNELLEFTKESYPTTTNVAREVLAKRHFLLAESGVDPIEHLTASKELIEPLTLGAELSLDGWVTYVRTLFRLGEYQEASKSIPKMLKSAQTENRKIADISLTDIVSIEYLARLNTPDKFLEEFGPFAAPIFAECKNIYLSEAWQSIYHESLQVSGNWQNPGMGILMGNVVIYELSRDTIIGGQPDIIMHELIHLGVRDHQAFRSEGKWFTAYRDVPTAALFTYMQYLGRLSKIGSPMPDCLKFYVELGRNSAKKELVKANQYIENMLSYFKMHGQETNASYQCAAIQAGMLLEIIGSPDSEEMNSYIEHLEVTDHKNALGKAKRRVVLEW